ncbi:sigma-70 family RNA polymerase sigma factor [Oceanihabitans sp. IOP_32]|uniref:RNA polymerase sigma factor n=1 Tax=Oceanihabitans sp. IOP_32 TaxID=2529032 RepID=UPI00129322BC|nr:sigma-70 family RNA polymerase sigma factor [Oceanihabitans sp. IOP_32]QFZ54772.1 sigma-70 family RNA polymerase sigma factor [Oceanihabitans sp. IOP_32]
MEEKHINSFIHGKPKEIQELYAAHKNAFLNFGKKYGLDNDDLIDIYQEAFIALRKHAINGKLANVKSSLKTYLFGIGKFMIFDLLKEKKKTFTLNTDVLSEYSNIEKVDIEFENEELTIEQQLLRTHFKKLGKKCREVLTLFYYRGLTIDDIVELTDYTSKSVVRSQKSRCLKSLKEMIKPLRNE